MRKELKGFILGVSVATIGLTTVTAAVEQFTLTKVDYPVTNEFPQTPDVQSKNANYSIAESELLCSLKLEKLTSKSEDSKPSLCGIWVDDNYILAVDGFRVGRIETENNAEQPFIINNKVIDILQKILNKKSNTEIKLYFSDTKKYIKIQSDNFSVIYRPYMGECLNINNFLLIRERRYQLIITLFQIV